MLDQLKLETAGGREFTLESKTSELCEAMNELCASFMRLATEVGLFTATIVPRLADEFCPNRKVKYLAKHAKTRRARKKNQSRIKRICAKLYEEEST